MRAALLAVVLAIVLAASALNLILGLLWLLALGLLAVARRRSRLGAALPVLAVVLVAGLAALGASRGWLDPPPAVSYGDDELGRLRRLWHRTPATEADGRAALIDRLQALREEEGAVVPAEVQRRAGAAVAFVRDLERLRAAPPAELAALEAAVRRLAFTLTSPEFRDLDDRRARAERWLRALEQRASLAPDEATLAGVRRAMDPASLASVTLGAVRDDLRRIDQATWAVIGALGGGEVRATATTSVALDDSRGEAVVETRYALEARSATRIVRIDPSPARGTVSTGSYPGQLTIEVGGEVRGAPAGGGYVSLEPAATSLSLVVRRVESLPVTTVQAPLRRIAFSGVAVPPRWASGDPGHRGAHVLVSVRPDGWLGALPLLAVDLPDPTVSDVAGPTRSLHWVSKAGKVTSSGSGPDVWRPGGEPVRLSLTVELYPASRVFRNRGFAALAPHMYGPSLAALLGLAGLAALTLVLVGRRGGAEPT